MKLDEVAAHFMTDHAQIEQWLIQHRKNRCIDGSWVIHPDGTVDIDGSALLSSEGIRRIPIQFGVVSGIFDVSENPLVSLKGAPSRVGSEFRCYSCPNLKSFKFIPRKMNSISAMDCPKLTSLVGIHDQIDELTGVSGNFMFQQKYITEGGLGLVLIKGLRKVSLTSSSGLPQFKIIEKYLGRPDDIFECQAELVEEGFEEFAKL